MSSPDRGPGRPAVVRRSPTRAGTVLRAEQLTARMRRVTVRSPDMVGVAVRPAQDVELLLREPTGRRVKRRYTIRHARPDDGDLDLDVLLHGTGAGSSWGADAAPGDSVEFQGPRGKLELRAAPWHVLCGDESALPAIAAICDALPGGERAVAVVEVDGPADELSVAADVRWAHRDGHDPGTPDLLVPAAERIDVPFADARVYLMGETRSMVALRALFEGRGVPHESIFVKGYWNIGRPDRAAGRSPAR